jgi:hypothetical protein
MTNFDTIIWPLRNLVSLRRCELFYSIDTFLHALLMDPDGMPALESLILHPLGLRRDTHRSTFEAVVLQRTMVSFCIVFDKNVMCVAKEERDAFTRVAAAYPHRVTLQSE